jgi:hypothetical protein
MSDDIWELKQRITKLSDDELIDMVTVAAKDYRKEALDYAREELKYRHIDLSKLTAREEDGGELENQPEAESEPEAQQESVGPVFHVVTPAASTCPCGGRLRPGTLVAEKEVTIIFADTREERFVRVLACSRCHQITFAVDNDTVISE